MIDITKIVTVKPEISLKAIGLLSYILINDSNFVWVTKTGCKVKDGAFAFRSAFKELIDAEIIICEKTRKSGRFQYKYSFNHKYI